MKFNVKLKRLTAINQGIVMLVGDSFLQCLDYLAQTALVNR